jgi:alpha-1,6-mannosyltransferase
MRRGPLAVGAFLLFGGQLALVWLAPFYAGARPQIVADVLPLILWLAVPAAVALVVVPRLANMPPTYGAIGLMLALGLIMRLVWLGVPPPLEDDFYRYLWDGALVAHGLDPYALAPDEAVSGTNPPPTLAALYVAGAGTLAHINFPDLKTIYPGVAELVFGFAHLLAPWRVDGLRIVLLASDLCATLLLAAALRRTGRSALLSALYWLNPLVVFTTTATAHVDGLLPPLLLAIPLALASARPRAAAACLALAAGIKIWPVLFAPLVFAEIARKRGPWASSALIFAALALPALTPLFASALTPSSGLAAYAGTWSNNNGPFAWASYAIYLALGDSATAEFALRAAVAAFVGAVALVLAARPLEGLEDALRRSTVIAAVLFYASPAQFPWYALWFMPFAAATFNRPLLLASATLPAYYLFFPLWESGRGSLYLYGTSFLHAVPVWAWIAWDARAWLRATAFGRASDPGIQSHV